MFWPAQITVGSGARPVKAIESDLIFNLSKKSIIRGFTLAILKHFI